jgi:hypothetical protein
VIPPFEPDREFSEPSTSFADQINIFRLTVAQSSVPTTGRYVHSLTQENAPHAETQGSSATRAPLAQNLGGYAEYITIFCICERLSSAWSCLSVHGHVHDGGCDSSATQLQSSRPRPNYVLSCKREQTSQVTFALYIYLSVNAEWRLHTG